MPDFSVMRRLERAELREASAATGVADELVSLERHRTKAAAALHTARTAAEAFPRRLPEHGYSIEALMDAENRRSDMLRQVRRQVRETGTDIAQFGAALAEASAPSALDFARAVTFAETDLARCEAAIAELAAERSRRGKRLGQLRQSIRQGRDWLQSHGFAAEVA